MKRFRSLSFVIFTAFVLSPTVVSVSASAQDGTWSTVHATDESYTIQLPKGWNVKTRSLEQFDSWSEQGEALFWYSMQIPEDRDSVQNQINGAKLLGNPISPERQRIMMRMISPRLSPREVIQTLFPHIKGDMVQQMQILSVETPPANPSQAMIDKMGIKAAIIHYRCILKPQLGDPLLRAGLPPPLQNLETVPQEGSVIIYVSPSTREMMGQTREQQRQFGLSGAFAYNWWNITVQGAQAPVAVYQKNADQYRRIFNSTHLNVQRITEIMQANQAMVDQIVKMSQETSRAIQKMFQP